MDVYEQIAERMHLDEMETDAPPLEQDNTEELTEVTAKPPLFTLEFGYHGFENMHPWPSCVEILPNGKLLVDYNRWPSTADVPAIANGRGVFPFRWSDKRISEQMSNEQAVQKLQNFIATLPVLVTVEYTPTLFMLLNGVELHNARSEKHQQPTTMLSTDILLFYLQIVYILKDNIDEQGKTLEQLAVCLENFNNALKNKLKTLDEIINNDAALKQLAHALHADPDIEKLNVEQRQHLVRFAELLEMFTINYMRLLEVLILNMAPFPDLASDSEKFNSIYKLHYLSKGGLPAALESGAQQQLLSNQLAFLRCKFERDNVPLPNITLTMEQCRRGLNMQACALYLYLMFVEKEN